MKWSTRHRIKEMVKIEIIIIKDDKMAGNDTLFLCSSQEWAHYIFFMDGHK